MLFVLDLEVDLGGDRKDPSPYNKDNYFVALRLHIKISTWISDW